jgi:uncharacterized delta-60 repeat protein
MGSPERTPAGRTRERHRPRLAREQPRPRLARVRLSLARVSLIAVLGALCAPAGASAASAPGLVTFPVPAHAGAAFGEAPGLGGVYALAALPGGNSLAAGLDQEGKHLAVAELLPDGSLDPAFGDGGVAIPSLPGGLRITPAAVLPEASGLLVIVGVSASGLSAVRLTAAGALDTSFGVHGIATIPKWTEGGVSGALSPAGGIVVAGQVEGSGELGVARLTSEGALDPSFASGGIAMLSGPDTSIVDSSVAALAGGVVLDAFGDKLAELTAAGAPNPSFAAGGTLALAGTARQILAQPGGGVLVLVPGQGVSSYSPTGALEASYGSGGKASAPTVGDSFDAPDAPSSQTLLPAPGGGTLVIGLDDGTTPTAVIARLTANGRYDPSAGPETQSVALPFGGGTFLEGRDVSLNQDPFSEPPPFAAIVRSDGSLVLASAVHVVDVPGAGALDSGFVTQWALAALTTTGALDPTFGAASALHIKLSLPRQRATGPSARACSPIARCILLALSSSAPGLAVVHLEAHGKVIAQTSVALFTTSRATWPIPLTRAGRRLLKAGRKLRVTVLLSAKDLAGNTLKQRASLTFG